MKSRRLVLIGFGAIAAEVADALLDVDTPRYDIAVLLRPGSPSRQRVPQGCTVLSKMADVSAFQPEIVVEAAGHGALREIVPECLALGLPVLISSIGALHDAALYGRLVAAARDNGGRLLLASGAIGALDYVRAMRHAEQGTLRYESRKPPAAWAAELRVLGHDPDRLSKPVTMFEGNARAAAAAYPQNLNVAAALAMAGPGFEGISVRVVCDPAAEGNTHVLRAESELGTMTATITNRPSPANPKSSWIVSRSLLAAIDQYFSPVMML